MGVLLHLVRKRKNDEKTAETGRCYVVAGPRMKTKIVDWMEAIAAAYGYAYVCTVCVWVWRIRMGGERRGMACRIFYALEEKIPEAHRDGRREYDLLRLCRIRKHALRFSLALIFTT